MDIRDPEGERRRLINLYARMTDGELEELASDPASLTEIARTVLMEEIKQRGLAFSFEVPQPEIIDRELPELISVCTFRFMSEAVIAKGALESAGIECFLYDERRALIDDSIMNPVSMPLLGESFRGVLGIDLRVRVDDAEAAKEILDHPIDELPENGE